MQNEHGVTLLELLVTIVILSILSVISIISVNQILTNVNEDAIIIETRNIKQAFDRYCLMEGCEEDQIYQAIHPLHPNYFGDYIELNTQVKVLHQDYDIVVIYYDGNSSDLIYYTPEGLWYIDNLFGYQNQLLDFNPFLINDPPMIFKSANYIYDILLLITD